MSRHVILGSRTRKIRRNVVQSCPCRTVVPAVCLHQLNVTEDGQERRSVMCRSATGSRVPDREDTCMSLSADITWTWHAAGNSTSGACHAWLLTLEHDQAGGAQVDTIQSDTDDFLLTFHSNISLSRTVSEINGDFRQKSPIFPTPVYLMPALKGHEIGYRRMGQKKLEWCGY